MKYAEYFGQMIKQSGVPRLSYQQFSRMMNIVFLEGEIRGMQIMREQHDYLTDQTRHLIYQQEMKLSDLTRNLKPDVLLKELIKLSNAAPGAFDVEGPWID